MAPLFTTIFGEIIIYMIKIKEMRIMSYMCAECRQVGCKSRDLTKTMTCCPSKNEELQAKAAKLYQEEENHHIANTAARVEAEGYGRLCRMEEIILFCKRAGYKKLGLVFCMGLHNEAREVNQILTHHGFEVASVICKNGALPKSSIGLTDADTLSGCANEVMCNPIGQALTMNEQKVDFNILFGLCVGHDTLAIKYLDAPCTVLAVKDRVTGHNPIAPIYVANSYYKNRFYGDK